MKRSDYQQFVEAGAPSLPLGYRYVIGEKITSKDHSNVYYLVSLYKLHKRVASKVAETVAPTKENPHQFVQDIAATCQEVYETFFQPVYQDSRGVRRVLNAVFTSIPVKSLRKSTAQQNNASAPQTQVVSAYDLTTEELLVRMG